MSMIRDTAFNRVLSSLYGAAIRIRNVGYDSQLLSSTQSELPVLSVGNIRVGGSGKSPFVQFVVTRLLELGRHPVILSRGYGGTVTEPTQVSTQSAELVGDEPLMHASRFGAAVPVVVARERVRGAELIVRDRLGDVIVLDDGFQHRKLARNLNCVLVDVSRESLESHYQGRLLPAGPMREHPSASLARTDLIVLLSRTSEPFAFAAPTFQGKPVIRVRLVPHFVRDAVSGERIELGALSGRSMVALSAIARPESFRDMLERSGVKLKAELVFPDHHQIDSEVFTQARALGYPVIVTAKDAVKLQSCANAPSELFVLELQTQVETACDTEVLDRMIQRALSACSKASVMDGGQR